MTNAIWIRDLGAFSVQVAALVFAGAAVAFLCRLRQPRAMLLFWRLLLFVCLALPFCQPWHASGAPPNPHVTVPMASAMPVAAAAMRAGAGAVIEIVWRSADPSADRGRSRSGRMACHGRARDSTFAARRRTTGADAARNSRSAAPCRRTRRHPRVGSSDRADDVRSIPSGGSAACRCGRDGAPHPGGDCLPRADPRAAPRLDHRAVRRGRTHDPLVPSGRLVADWAHSAQPGAGRRRGRHQIHAVQGTLRRRAAGRRSQEVTDDPRAGSDISPPQPVEGARHTHHAGVHHDYISTDRLPHYERHRRRSGRCLRGSLLPASGTEPGRR